MLTYINQGLLGYAISHNKDSELKEVTVFVFTSEDDFKKMLKNQGISKDALDKLAKTLPVISTGASAAATAMGNPELIPVIKAVGLGLAGASKYAVGPARWLMEQKYNVAIHKHTKRGNKGKDAKWNWKDIKKDTGINKDDPYGLFVVFLNPKDKKVLLMSPMRTNEAFGFKAITKDGKLIGERVRFERNAKELTKDPSYAARIFAYLVNRYENPHKVLRDIKKLSNDMKSNFKAFRKKYPGTKNKLQFLSTKLDEAKEIISEKLSEKELIELAAFFQGEIEATKQLATDKETQEFINRVIRKFNQFKDAAEAIIIKPMAAYQSEISKGEKPKGIIPDIPLLKGPTQTQNDSDETVDDNHYTMLGVAKNASADDIKKAYRTLARKWHPDRNQDNKEEATAMFKKINAAYSALNKL